MPGYRSTHTGAQIDEAIKRGLSPVDTLQDLRDSTSTAEIIYVRAHTTAGDGGHGNFRLVTGAAPGTYTDNNGTIIVPTGGDGSSAWLRMDQVITPQMFGADATGSIYSTTALQSYSDTLSDGDDFFIPSGSTFKSSGTITISSNVNINMQGLIIADFDNAPLINITVPLSNKIILLNMEKDTPSNWLTDTSCAVKFSTLSSSVVTVKKITGFLIGLEFTYTTAAQYTAWTKFYLNYINNCKYGVKIHLQAVGSWWNENQFYSPFVRVDSGNNPGLDFYYIHGKTDNYNSFNRNSLFYPAFEGARCIGLYIEKGSTWNVIQPRNESISAGRSIQYVNTMEMNPTSINEQPYIMSSVSGVWPFFISNIFTADILTSVTASPTPMDATPFNLPVFHIADMVRDDTANTVYPFQQATIGSLATPTFSSSKVLPAGSSVSWVKEHGGYTMTYDSTISKNGILIDLQGASLLTLHQRGSTIRYRVVFLDAALNLIFNSGTTATKGENFVGPTSTWLDGYGFVFGSDANEKQKRNFWINNSTVKYIMLFPTTKNGFLQEFTIFTDSDKAKIVY